LIVKRSPVNEYGDLGSRIPQGREEFTPESKEVWRLLSRRNKHGKRLKNKIDHPSVLVPHEAHLQIQVIMWNMINFL
jgi:hypothetical protein